MLLQKQVRRTRPWPRTPKFAESQKSEEPKAKKSKKSDAGGSKEPKSKNTKKSATKESDEFDVSDVTLEGEDKDAVKVLDTCQDIRVKINRHLRKPGVSQAALARTLSQMYNEPNNQVQPRQLKRFLEKKGPSAGNTSPVFYSAYVFFEKLRVKKGAKKSQKREEMKKTHPDGMDVKFDHSWGMLCHSSERPYEDQYGKISIVKR